MSGKIRVEPLVVYRLGERAAPSCRGEVETYYWTMV